MRLEYIAVKSMSGGRIAGMMLLIPCGGRVVEILEVVKLPGENFFVACFWLIKKAQVKTLFIKGNK